jgi:ribosomal protein L37E
MKVSERMENSKTMEIGNQDIMDCPRCGKKGLVRPNHTIYQCLCCGFKRNLAEPNFGADFLWIVFALILTLSIWGNRESRVFPKDDRPRSQMFHPHPETVENL